MGFITSQISLSHMDEEGEGEEDGDVVMLLMSHVTRLCGCRRRAIAVFETDFGIG